MSGRNFCLFRRIKAPYRRTPILSARKNSLHKTENSESKNFFGVSAVAAAGVRARRGQAGFTLLEVLIVVIILGILAAAAVMNYIVALDKARLSSCKTALDNIKNGLEIYMVDNKGYPSPDGVGTLQDLMDLLKGFADFKAPMTCDPDIVYEADVSTYRVEARVRYANGKSNIGVKLVLEDGELREERVGPL